jgi:hypothetical protein
MDDIPPRSYGPLIETTVWVITWNVWGLYDPWQEREAAIVVTLRDVRPDILSCPSRGPKAAIASALAWPVRSACRTMLDTRRDLTEPGGCTPATATGKLPRSAAARTPNHWFEKTLS